MTGIKELLVGYCDPQVLAVSERPIGENGLTQRLATIADLWEISVSLRRHHCWQFGQVHFHKVFASYLGSVDMMWLAAAKKRDVEVLWVLVSDCLWERTPLEGIQAASDTKKPLDSLSASQQKTALKTVVQKIDAAWQTYERPRINKGLIGHKMNRVEPSLHVLSMPARRRTEVFVHSESAKAWWHQGSIMPGKTHGKCCFGDEKTRPGTPFKIVALTTDEKVGGRTERLPRHRTRSADVAVVRR